MMLKSHQTESGFQRENDSMRQEREINESMKYASYIQQALFPSESIINRLIPDHFIFYQPREAVSGDFYFVSGRNDKIVIAVGDCTGHGIPGAFMSILGITFLNEIISHGTYSGAGSVLNQMRERVMEALCQTGNDYEQKDGIDLALCLIDPVNSKLEYAGAFNPVYIVRDQNLIEISGDKMPVGVGAEEERSFTSHTYDICNNDILYLFSDGFADQFGGPQGKKFKYQSFRKMLCSVSNLPMEEQKQVIRNTFNGWKGNNQQLDDVLVLGFRYLTLI
jgi:serine phosphatase RsbU (regulator of sigma subunit)